MMSIGVIGTLGKELGQEDEFKSKFWEGRANKTKQNNQIIIFSSHLIWTDMTYSSIFSSNMDLVKV